jgi:hypothetical protein
MGRMPSKLKMTLVVKFLERRLTSSYLIIIAKVFESVFEGDDVNVTLKVLDN